MGTGAFDITSDVQTGWQVGNLRIGLDRDVNEADQEIYNKTISLSIFRDHESITDLEDIFSDADASSGLAITASFHGATDVAIRLSSEYDAEAPSSGTSVWYLQDTTLEPIELQGSKFVRETQEWTAQLPDWVVAPWQTLPS